MDSLQAFKDVPDMKVWNSTLAATLIGTVAGVVVWFLGLAKLVWAAHPQFAAFLITVANGIVTKLVWPDSHNRFRLPILKQRPGDKTRPNALLRRAR